MLNDKREARKRQLEGIIMINSNPISARWATHKLENNSTKGSPTVVNVLSPMSDFPSWDLAKGLQNPRDSDHEGQLALIIGILQD